MSSFSICYDAANAARDELVNVGANAVAGGVEGAARVRGLVEVGGGGFEVVQAEVREPIPDILVIRIGKWAILL